MDYTDEQLTTIEQLASVYMTISDMALILMVPVEELRADIANSSSMVSMRYRRGKALSKLEIRKQEMQLAKVGSPLALDNVNKNLLDMEDDE